MNLSNPALSPVCSVIIPSYNCLAFLPATLASVFAQNIEALEVIVIDDQSTDGTGDYLADYAAREPRLKILQGAHKGPSAARNLGLTIANAPLIAFLDADDSWCPGKLTVQLAFHQAHKDVVFSFSDYLHLDPAGRSLGTCFDYWKPKFMQQTGYFLLPDALNEILACNLVGTSCVVVRTDALRAVGGFHDNLHSAEDWELWLRLCALGPVTCSAAVTMLYLVRPGSVSRNQQRRINAKQAILDAYRDGNTSARQSAIAKAQALIAIAQAENARESGSFWSAAYFHILALRVMPNLRIFRAIAADIVAALRVRPVAAGL